MKPTYPQIKTILAIMLVVFFGIAYWPAGGGSWGGDADGYYMGAHYLKEKGTLSPIRDPLLTELVSKGYEQREELLFMSNLRYSITEDYEMVYRYPPYLSSLIATFSEISPENLTLLPWLCAIMALLLFFLLLTRLLSEEYLSLAIAGITTAGLGSLGLFSDYAMAQPMRELPLIVMNLLILYAFFIAYQKDSNRWFLLSIVLAIISLYLRYTNIFIFLIYVPFCISWLMAWKYDRYTMIQQLVYCSFGVILVIPLLLFNLENTANLLTPASIDHVQAMSITHLFDNGGPYRAHQGSLVVYAAQLFPFAKLPFIIAGIFIAISQRYWMLLGYPLATLLLFSLWTNPYDRYILPIYIFIYLLMGLGLSAILTYRKLLPGVRYLLFGSYLLLMVPGILSFAHQEFLSSHSTHKAITQSEMDTLDATFSSLDGVILLDSSHVGDMMGYLSFRYDHLRFMQTPPDYPAFESWLEEHFDEIYLLTDRNRCSKIEMPFNIKGQPYALCEMPS